MSSFAEMLFKLDEGVLVTAVVAIVTPLLAAPAERLLDRGERRRAAKAASAEPAGDGPNDATVRVKGNRNKIRIDQRHTTTNTTINVNTGRTRSDNPMDEPLVLGFVALVVAACLTVLFLKVGATPLKVSGGVGMGLSIGVLVHLTRTGARLGERVKALVLVACAAAVFATGHLMDGFVVRGASLATANEKLVGWHLIASWGNLRSIEKTLGQVFLGSTLAGVLAIVLISLAALGLVFVARGYRQGGLCPATPALVPPGRWQQSLAARSSRGSLVAAVILVAVTTVLGCGVAVEPFHRMVHQGQIFGGGSSGACQQADCVEVEPRSQ